MRILGCPFGDRFEGGASHRIQDEGGLTCGVTQRRDWSGQRESVDKDKGVLSIDARASICRGVQYASDDE